MILEEFFVPSPKNENFLEQYCCQIVIFSKLYFFQQFNPILIFATIIFLS